MGYSQNDRPRREQWVYVGQSETLVNDQPSSSVRYSTASYTQNDYSVPGYRLGPSLEDTNYDVPAMAAQSRFSDWGSTTSRSSSELSYAQNDRGSLGFNLSTNIYITNNTIPSHMPSTPQPPQPTSFLHTPRAHKRDSTFSYAQHDHGSVQQRVGANLTITQETPQYKPDVLGERDDWSGRDSNVYNRSKEEQFDSFVMGRKRGQYYKNLTEMVKAKVKEFGDWVTQGLRQGTRNNGGLGAVGTKDKLYRLI